jgi:hypothetical protein
MLYAEYLRSPHHNTLTYGRVPRNHLMLFGAMLYPEERFISDFDSLVEYADELGIESVPLVYHGAISSPDFILGMMERESVLGNAKIEGLVVKNYHNPFLLGGQPIRLMAGKYVSEAFKEVHRDTWKKENTGQGKWASFLESFRTEARWAKAVQHLAESGELTNSPRDIGPLLKEVQRDITEEEASTIKQFLWKQFGQEVLRTAVRGFPEWYKEQLLTRSMEEVA